MTRNLDLLGNSGAGQQIFAVSLSALLFIDGLFLGAHILRTALNETSCQGFLLDRGWSLELHGSYPEQFQCLLAGLVGDAFSRDARGRRQTRKYQRGAGTDSGLFKRPLRAH